MGKGEPQSPFGVPLPCRMVQGAAQVGGLGVEPPQPPALIVPVQPLLSLDGQLRVVPAMRVPHPFGLAGLVQPVAAIGGHRLQQPVARAVGPMRDRDKGAVDQPAEQARHVGTIDPGGPGAHLFGRLQRAAVGVDRQAPEHDAFRFGEQVPAPVDHRHQGPLAFGCVPAADGQQPEPVVEPGHQLGHTEGPDPGSGQLERQR